MGLQLKMNAIIYTFSQRKPICTIQRVKVKYQKSSKTQNTKLNIQPSQIETRSLQKAIILHQRSCSARAISKKKAKSHFC